MSWLTEINRYLQELGITEEVIIGWTYLKKLLKQAEVPRQVASQEKRYHLDEGEEGETKSDNVQLLSKHQDPL